MEIQAPMKFTSSPRPWIFLAGSIEMGTAVQWQKEAVERLQETTILNPRRDDWDSSWIQSIEYGPFREQVEWELQAMEESDYIFMYFDPAAKSPITLLELGLYAASDKLIIVCPEGFWRRGNVEIVADRYKVPLFDRLETGLAALAAMLRVDVLA